MLILTRGLGEAVIIGNDITLRVHALSAAAVSFDATVPPGTRAEYVTTGGQIGILERKTVMVGPRLVLPRDEFGATLIHPDGQTVMVRPFLPGWRGDQVRIGFGAPRTLPVHREEIARRIAQGVPRRRGAAHLTVVALLAVLSAGCATGDELRGDWSLTVGRAGTCRVIAHQAKTDQLQTRTIWRGEGCIARGLEAADTEATLLPAAPVEGGAP